jgi:membrane protease subunit HflC
VIVAALVFVGLLTYLFVFSVRVDQVAAHYRFGTVKEIIRPTLALGGEEKVRTTADGVPIKPWAGLYFKLPWPFDKVWWFDQRVRCVDGPQAQIQLPDQNQLIPRVYATWRILDPVAFQKSLMGEEETAQQTLKQIIGGRTPEVFGRYTLRDIVNTDRQALKFDQIERELYDAVKSSVESSEKAYGIEVCSVGISWIALPGDATAAVFGRMQQERKTEAQKLTEDGNKIKRTTIAEAEQKRALILANAEAQAKAIRAEGEAEAAKSYATFAQEPYLAIFLQELEALKKLTKGAADRNEPITFVLSTKTPPVNLLQNGPLGEQATGNIFPEIPAPLGKQAGAPVTGTPPPATPGAAQPDAAAKAAAAPTAPLAPAGAVDPASGGGK